MDSESAEIVFALFIAIATIWRGAESSSKARSAGVRVSSIEILHVNKKYVRGQKGVSWPKFFRRLDVKAEAKRRCAGIETRLKKQLGCLSRTQAPKVEPEAHCHSPYSCEHWERCTASKPADWVFYMPASQCPAARRIEGDRGGIHIGDPE